MIATGSTSPLTFAVLVAIALTVFAAGALLERRYSAPFDDGDES